MSIFRISCPLPADQHGARSRGCDDRLSDRLGAQADRDGHAAQVHAVTRNRRQALEAWRVSLSHLTTTEEIEAFISAYNEIIGGEQG